MVFQALAFSMLFAADVAADCSRQTLQDVVDKYVSSVQNGKMTVPLANDIKYSENFKDLNIGSGILSKPVTLAYNRSLLDSKNCATFTELLAPNNNPGYGIATQIQLDPDTKKASRIESIVNKQGGWFFNATATLNYALSENHATISEDKRDTREALKAAADAYFDAFSDPEAMKRVPWNTPGPCTRVEGGLRVSPCQVGIFPPAQKAKDTMTNRRYVIDETVGSIDLFLSFGGFAPDSHEFRLENGKIRYIRAFTDMPSADRLAGKDGAGGIDLGNLLGGLGKGGINLSDVKVEGLGAINLSELLGGKGKGTA